MLYRQTHADHVVLQIYTYVRWLSKGNVVNLVELENENWLFLEVQDNHVLVAYFDEEAWNKRVANLADILNQRNKFNIQLQGKESDILQFQVNLQAFVSKLQNWRRKVNLVNITMFEQLYNVVRESQMRNF